MRWMVLCAAMAAVIGGCVSANPGAQDVVISGNAEMVRGCKFLQQTRGGSLAFTGSGLFADSAMQDAYNSLRNKAVELGGTHVVTVSVNPNSAGLGIVGDIYKCA